MPSPHSTITSAIRSRFHTSIAQAFSYLIIYDNQRFRPSDISLPWIRLTIGFTRAAQIQLGSPKLIRHLGNWTALIHVPLEGGDGPAWVISDNIYNTFNNKKLDNILYRTPVAAPAGMTAGWWHLELSCPWQYDELST